MQNGKQMACSILVAVGLIVAIFGTAHASLLKIGSAEYLGQSYNLIYDADNNGNSLIWLDYSHTCATCSGSWDNHSNWAINLETNLTNITLNPGYSINWLDNSWRLPSTVDGLYVSGFDGTTTGGYNITTSEFGHLFYTELGNIGKYDSDGDTQTGYGLANTGPFEQLQSRAYFSTLSTENLGEAWTFYNPIKSS